MASWFNISARFVVMPLVVASLCVAIPHAVFIRSDVDIPRTMTLIAAVTWGATLMGFSVFRKWLNLIALGLATLSVFAIWGGHVLIARESFRMYIGFPSVFEYTMAAGWWGAYFALLFGLLFPLHNDPTLNPRTDQQATPHPGMDMAGIFAIVNFGLVAVIAIITLTTRSYRFTFPALATLHLPLQTIKDYARPGMGSGGYLPGSILLYAVFGSLFQSVLAWAVCRVGWSAGIFHSTNRDTDAVSAEPKLTENQDE